jgi:hypothetical protein
MSDRGGCPRVPRNLRAAVLAGFLVFPVAVQAQQAELTYDRNDAEIQAFRTQNTVAPRTFAPEESNLNSIQIPVLAFDAVPGLVQRSLAPGEAPQRERSVVTNPDDPVWYAIEDSYGDITITVKADARISHSFPENYPVAAVPDGTAPDNASRAAGISVLDQDTEPGFEGVIAEYTVYKFPNIPYTVTIECAEHLRQQCRDLGVLAQDQDSLRLIAVPPE